MQHERHPMKRRHIRTKEIDQAISEHDQAIYEYDRVQEILKIINEHKNSLHPLTYNEIKSLDTRPDYSRENFDNKVDTNVNALLKLTLEGKIIADFNGGFYSVDANPQPYTTEDGTEIKASISSEQAESRLQVARARSQALVAVHTNNIPLEDDNSLACLTLFKEAHIIEEDNQINTEVLKQKLCTLQTRSSYK